MDRRPRNDTEKEEKDWKQDAPEIPNGTRQKGEAHQNPRKTKIEGGI